MSKIKIPLRCKIRKHFQIIVSPSGLCVCKYGLKKRPIHLCNNCPLSYSYISQKAFEEELMKAKSDIMGVKYE